SMFGSVLRTVLASVLRAGLDQMSAYDWARLARLLVPGDPVGVAQLVAGYVTRQRDDSAGWERLPEPLRDVLLEAARTRSDDVFDAVLAPLIDSVPLVFWRLESTFERDPGILSAFDAGRV